MIKAGLTLAEWIARLSKGYLKHTGKQPDGLAKIKIKMEAAEKVRQQDKILKPDFKSIPRPKNQIMGSKGIKGVELAEDRKKRLLTEGKEMMDKLGLKEFTRREDLYEGLPKALRNVKNPEEVKKLLDSGAIKIGKAPKTKKTKESFADIKKRMEAKNKESAFNFAFKKYKDIDKKPMEMDEVISIYTNLNKYPKGRSIIFGDIAEIQRRHMLPNIGNRSRDDLINKLNKMVLSKKKQPNPFKKAPDEVTDQIEMDFTDWDPKGMKGGGIAHMLGQPRVPMMYGGDPGFAFEYGGSWADWNDNHKHMMPVTEYIGTKLPKDRLPFRQDVADGGRIGFKDGTAGLDIEALRENVRKNPEMVNEITDFEVGIFDPSETTDQGPFPLDNEKRDLIISMLEMGTDVNIIKEKTNATGEEMNEAIDFFKYGGAGVPIPSFDESGKMIDDGLYKGQLKSFKADGGKIMASAPSIEASRNDMAWNLFGKPLHELTEQELEIMEEHNRSLMAQGGIAGMLGR